MAGEDKIIRIGAEASSLAKARKEVDALQQALEKLRKSGVALPGGAGAGKIGDLTSAAGVAKYSKELLAATGHMDRLTGRAKEFVRAMGDNKVAATLRSLSREYDTATSKLERLSRVWERLEQSSARSGRAISDRTRDRLSTQAATLQASRTRLGGEMLQVEGVAPPGQTGLQRALGGWGGKVGAAALGGAAYMLATGIPGGLADRYTSQREAATATSAVFSQYAGQILAGKGDREAYLRRLGVEDRAIRDARALTPLSLAGRGRFGAALGVRSTAGAAALDYGTAMGAGALLGSFAGPAGMAVGAGVGALAAGGIRFWQGGVRGLFEDPAAQRRLEFVRQRGMARQAYESQVELPVQVREAYMARMPAISALQRMRGLPGGQITGALPGLGDFTFDQVVGAQMAQGRVGARGVAGTAAALRMARFHGVENAPELAARLGLATGFRGDQTRQLESVLARAFEAGMGRTEMKVERESMVTAIVEATSRQGAGRFLAPGAGEVQARVMATGIQPGVDTMQDIAAAARAAEHLRARTGAEEGQFGAIGARTVRNVLGKAGLSGRVNLADLGYLQRLGASDVTTDVQAREIVGDLTGGDAVRTENILRSLSMNKAKGFLGALGIGGGRAEDLLTRAQAGKIGAREMNALAREMMQRDTGITDIRMARQIAEQNLGIMGGTATPGGAALAGGPTVPATANILQEQMVGQADLTVLKRAEEGFKDIVGAMADGRDAAKDFDEVLRSMSGPDGSMQAATESLDANLKIITARLESLAKAAASFPGAAPYGAEQYPQAGGKPK